VLEDAPEDVLENLLRVLTVAGQPERETEDSSLVSGDECLDGAVFASPEASDELDIFGRIVCWRHRPVDDRTLRRDPHHRY